MNEWELVNKNMNNYIRTMNKFNPEDRALICAFVIFPIINEIIQKKMEN